MWCERRPVVSLAGTFIAVKQGAGCFRWKRAEKGSPLLRSVIQAISHATLLGAASPERSVLERSDATRLVPFLTSPAGHDRAALLRRGQGVFKDDEHQRDSFQDPRKSSLPGVPPSEHLCTARGSSRQEENRSPGPKRLLVFWKSPQLRRPVSSCVLSPPPRFAPRPRFSFREIESASSLEQTPILRRMGTPFEREAFVPREMHPSGVGGEGEPGGTEHEESDLLSRLSQARAERSLPKALRARQGLPPLLWPD